VHVHVLDVHVPALAAVVNFTHYFWNIMKIPFFSKPPTVSPGLHHYNIVDDGYRSQIHLRIDPDGFGTLMLNANRIVHFNPTATLMAFLLLEKVPVFDAIKTIKSKYRVSQKEASDDYKNFISDFELIIKPDACPICAVDNIEISTPFSTMPTAPYRMDLAITYRCNNNCSHCYNDRPRDYPEISTEQWKKIIDKIWELGIPHIVFTGGEPTLRKDLPELISHAEKNGQITGLNTNGRLLRDIKFVNQLVRSGLDHIQITLESHDPSIHDGMVAKSGAWEETVAGIRNVLDTPLYVMTNTTMLIGNSGILGQTLAFLGKLGVPTVGLNALIYSGKGLTVGTGLLEKDLPPLLDLARNLTGDNNQKLIWYTPTQYCQFDPTQLELGIKSCTAALYNMCIEPDGCVIPCQSYYHQLGHILNDSWDSLWNHQLSKSLRNRQYADQECLECILLPECGGGCPLVHKARNEQIIHIERIPVLNGFIHTSPLEI